MLSVECGVMSLKCGVWHVEFEVFRVESQVFGVQVLRFGPPGAPRPREQTPPRATPPLQGLRVSRCTAECSGLELRVEGLKLRVWN